ARHEALQGVAVEADQLAQELDRQEALALGLFLEDNLGKDRAGDVFAGAGIAHLELGSFLHHLSEMVERHITRGLGVVESAVRILLDDARGLGVWAFFRHARISLIWRRFTPLSGV